MDKYYSSSRLNPALLLLLLGIFSLSPIMALFIVFFFMINTREALWIVVLFTAFWGFIMHPIGESNDLSEYLSLFQSYSNWSFNTFKGYLINYLNQDAIADDVVGTDIYIASIAFLVSRFSMNPHVTMMFFGLVLGVFYAASLRQLQKHLFRKNFISILIILVFSFTISLASLGGIRYVTASYLFFYGAVGFIEEEKWHFFFIALSSVLIHFSFFLMVPLLLFIRFYGDRISLFFKVYIGSCLFLFISDLGFLKMLQGDIGIIKKIDSYSDAEYNDYMQTAKNGLSIQAYLIVNAKLWFFTYVFFRFSVFLKSVDKIIITQKSIKSLTMSMIIMSVANVFSSMIILRDRLYLLVFMFGCYFIFQIYNDNKNSRFVKNTAILLMIASIFHLAYEVTRILRHGQSQLFFGNVFTVFD